MKSCTLSFNENLRLSVSPVQAFECELMEIRPSSVKCPDGVWTEEAKKTFENMVLYKSFFAQVRGWGSAMLTLHSVIE